MLKDRKPGVVFFPHFIPEVGIPLCQTLWLKWIYLFSVSKQKKKKDSDFIVGLWLRWWRV